MKLALIGIGVFLVVFGLIDFGGGLFDFDLWGTIGIDLPNIVWKFSAYIEIAIGYAMFNAGIGSSDGSDEE